MYNIIIKQKWIKKIFDYPVEKIIIQGYYVEFFEQ